jgi:hypothetical protein
LINSRGSHAGNNAQQIASRFSRSPQADRAKNLPSHYDLLLITGVMASSPLLNPGTDVVGVAHGWHDAERGADERACHFGDQLFARVRFRAERPGEIATEPGGGSAPMTVMPISA